jgi:mannose-6-phosphate isomerase-like protein (cupin superfamily)
MVNPPITISEAKKSIELLLSLGLIRKGVDGTFERTDAVITAGDELSVIEERMPPNTTEKAHHHKTATQFFRVLKGVLTREVEGERYSLKAGEGLEVSPGERHKAINASGQPCVFLVCSAPSTEDDRIEAKAR